MVRMIPGPHRPGSHHEPGTPRPGGLLRVRVLFQGSYPL